MGKQKGIAGVLILVGILVMVVIAGGAYYLGKSNTPQPSSISVVSQTSQPVVQTPTDETANWKTYTYNKDKLTDGFAFKYPANWEYEEPAKLWPSFFQTDVKRDYTTNNHKGNETMRILVYTATTLQALKRSIANQPNMSETQVQGKPALQAGNNTIDILLKPYDKERDTILHMEIYSNQVILDQILSTFKFTQ